MMKRIVVLMFALSLSLTTGLALAENADDTDAGEETPAETTDAATDETTDEAADEGTGETADATTDEGAIKAKMVENYLLLREALKNADSDRIISFQTPDYTYVAHDGKVLSKEESDAMTHNGMNRFHKVHYANASIKHFTVEPTRVVIVSETHVDADVLDEEKKPHHLHMSGKSRDIWVKVGPDWMLKRSECIACKTEKDKH